MLKLHTDIETYSETDLISCGSYKYFKDPNFEILMVAYAFNDSPVEIIDLAQGESLPEEFIDALLDPNIIKCAHNANFERNAFKAYGYDIPPEQWECSAIKAAYCGLPLSLAKVSKALSFGEDLAKKSTGRALIRYFSVPRKPTKNNPSTRNLPEDDLERWEAFKEYCIQDVVAEREIDRVLSDYEIPEREREAYVLDQRINDRGILVDTTLAEGAINIDTRFSNKLEDRVRELTGVDNPNSAAQLKDWLTVRLGKEVTGLAKADVNAMLETAEGDVREVLLLRQKMAKTSIKKYQAMLNVAGQDQRARGLFQFYGANRTGRWAGRLIQLQNLPRNYLHNLEDVREVVRDGDYETMSMVYDNISNPLSQLIRTGLIGSVDGSRVLAVADFSAIEARVVAWLAQEEWRMDVFRSHGKIYEASASMMFGVPFESITKESDLRQRGKVAELALGYQGSVGAMKTMGGEQMGLSEGEMQVIVDAWRKASPSIVGLWEECEKLALRAIKTKGDYVSGCGRLTFTCDDNYLMIGLPSGRSLFYRSPKIARNRWGKPLIKYMGIQQNTGKWGWVDSYGGKLVENITQAVARDLLSEAMLRVDRAGYEIVIHVHDELGIEVDADQAEHALRDIYRIMAQRPEWAGDLPLVADGFISTFYKK